MPVDTGQRQAVTIRAFERVWTEVVTTIFNFFASKSNVAVSDARAEKYASFNFLWEVEKPLFEYLKSLDLTSMSMLDLGVGAGRTTEIFAPLVRHYVGIDYSPAMIDVCRRKFGERIINGQFLEGDACDLSTFGTGSFDFVLFSFNGIDYNTAEERVAALREIRRVLKPDGWFCFSSHNANWVFMDELFRLHIDVSRRRPVTYLVELVRQVQAQWRLRLNNRSLFMKPLVQRIRNAGCGYLYDVTTEPDLRNYFISYERQVKQLQDTGFERIRAYSARGMETDALEELNAASWIYYLARTPGEPPQQTAAT